MKKERGKLNHEEVNTRTANREKERDRESEPERVRETLKAVTVQRCCFPCARCCIETYSHKGLKDTL